MLYQDFDLLIDRCGDNLRAQVLNSPAGQASSEFRLPFSEDKLEVYLLRLGRTRHATRRVESQEMNTAKTFGAALFDAVFSGDVKACFRSSIDEVRRQNAGLRIRLRLGDPSVTDLPWEFLYNRSVNRFIALSVHTPLVRFLELPERIQPIAVKPPIRVLVMISSPSDFPPLDVEAEWTRLNDSLEDRIAAGQLAIERLAGASLEALQHRLRRGSYHIFHFIGHGEFNQERQEGVLILEAENRRGHRVDGQFLGMLLHDHESLRMAILNACEGARTSRTDPFAGSAQSLVQQGIPAVIAMQFEIADDVASRFAHEFYGALADGYPIDASLTEARKSIFAAGREVEWGTPVLYLRAPDGRIFDIESSPPPPRAIRDQQHAVDSPGRENRDRFADTVVAAAQAAFAGGQHAEAIEMLRRHGPSAPGISEALRTLTYEHERLLAEAYRATAGKIDEHVRAAARLLESGRPSQAWGHACEALQLDPTDEKVVALEARVRKALEDQAGRDRAREQEETRRRQEARAREQEETRRHEEVRAREQEETRRHEEARAGEQEDTRRRQETRAREQEEMRRQKAARGRELEGAQERARRSTADRRQAIAAILRNTRVQSAAAVVFVMAAAFWLVPLAVQRSKQSPPVSAPASAPASAPERAATERPEPARDPPPQTAAAAPANPAAPAPTTADGAPEPSDLAASMPVGPATATAGTALPVPVAPNETTTADFRDRVRVLVAKKDVEQALSALLDGLAHAPADKELLALGPRIVEQARARTTQERSKALARGGSGQPGFKRADRTVQRAGTLARERKIAASARAYLDAAELFAASTTGSAAGRSRAEADVSIPEAPPVEEPESAVTVPPVRTTPPPVRAKPTLAMVDPIIDAYASAMSRGDRAALIAVYPSAPPELVQALANRPPGYNMRITNRFMVTDSRDRPEVVLTVIHEPVADSGGRDGKPQRLVLTLDVRGESWKIVGSR